MYTCLYKHSDIEELLGNFLAINYIKLTMARAEGVEMRTSCTLKYLFLIELQLCCM